VNVEFHYYTVYYLATEAGFSPEDARTLAYSSQYLDNALVPYVIDLGDQPDPPSDISTYQTLVTHHYGFWNQRQELHIWVPFHFFPAGPEAPAPPRRDKKRNPFNVVANSKRVQRLLVNALKTRNLYRVGIALHTYADSWAHQHFSGRNEAWNRLDPNSPLPPIGHAQALRDPDGLDVHWTDPRLAGEAAVVDNRARFMAAAGRIYRYLATYNRRSFADEELVLDRLAEMLGRPGEKSRTERRNEFVIALDAAPYRAVEWRAEAFEIDRADEELSGSTMDKLAWIKDEILHKSEIAERRRRTAKPRFFSSNLFMWDQAARGHFGDAVEILSDLV
jgi:hypothetical protein